MSEQIPQALIELAEVIEFKNDGPAADADLSDIWIAGHPIGNIVEKTNIRSRENKQKIQRIANGDETDAGILEQVDTEALPPIHQLYLTVEAGNADTLSDNQRRAAKIWPHYRDYADKSYGGLSLTSGKVRDIFERELDDEPDNPHAQTIRRVMENLETFSNELIQFNRDHNPNRAVADVDDWESLMGQVQDGMGETSADDSVSPETGQDEATSDATETKEMVIAAGDGGVEVGRR